MSTAAATDGTALAITRFPAQRPAWATMVLASAMGVRQDFYAPFARFAAKSGVHVLTFDYRGSGASLQGRVADMRADVSDWCEKDLAAMLREAAALEPALPLAFFGHSLGGQLLGAVPGNERVRAAITVAAGSGWYRFNDRMPLQVRVLWFVAMPLLTRLFGYFPGKRLRMVGDLPRGVAAQWRRWCLHPDYLLAEEGYREAFARVRCPIASYSFEDDPMITRHAVDNLHGFFVNAAVERRHLAPADVQARSVGHFGFFAERSRDRLWIPALEWLRTHTRQEAPCPATMAS